MISGRTIRWGLSLVAAVGMLAVGPVAVRAQGFGGGMPPEIAAKIKLWTKWRDQHKNVSNLQTMLWQVQQLDKSPDTKLSKPQAAKLLTILKTWRNKPTMNEDQAHSVQNQIGNLMSLKQVKKMTTLQPPWARMGGGGRPGGGGGGGPRPGGPGGFKLPDPPKGSYNPLNPDTLPFEQMRPMAKRGMDAFLSDLSLRSK